MGRSAHQPRGEVLRGRAIHQNTLQRMEANQPCAHGQRVDGADDDERSSGAAATRLAELPGGAVARVVVFRGVTSRASRPLALRLTCDAAADESPMYVSRRSRRCLKPVGAPRIRTGDLLS